MATSETHRQATRIVSIETVCQDVASAKCDRRPVDLEKTVLAWILARLIQTYCHFYDCSRVLQARYIQGRSAETMPLCMTTIIPVLCHSRGLITASFSTVVVVFL